MDSAPQGIPVLLRKTKTIMPKMYNNKDMIPVGNIVEPELSKVATGFGTFP